MGSCKALPYIALLLCGFGWSALAEPSPSLLPIFGSKGGEFTKASKDDHLIKGWLPAKWIDNSKWAAVNATYTKLAESPDQDLAAVRIEIKNVDDGQLQLTTFDGNHDYKKGTKYVVSGWVRSERFTLLRVGAREFDDPHDFYDQIEVPTGAQWKRFEFVFAPEMDCMAWIMFIVKDAGTVDIAGITVAEKP
jgi:hypothetical protein